MTQIRVSVQPAVDDEGLVRNRTPSLEEFRDRAGEIATTVREVASALAERLDADDDASTSWAMDSVTVRFEIALEAGAGVIIARTSASATFGVEIGWTRRNDLKIYASEQ